MKPRTLLAIAALICFALPAAADSAVHCGRLLDIAAGKIQADQIVEISDGRIQAVHRRRPSDAAALDLGTLTCLPGFIDLHVHLDGQLGPMSYLARFQDSEADLAYKAAANARKTLAAGFTTVRNLGDSYNVTIALRDAIAAGLVPGPRIYSAGKSLATTGGHADPTNGFRPDLMGDPGPAEGVVNSVEDARKAVRQRYKDGADVIKITATGGVLSLAKNGQNAQFMPDELAAVVDTARQYGMHVAAHAHGSEGMKRAVLAGVRTIEHGTYMTDEIMRLMIERGTWYVPTISAGRFVAAKAAESGFLPEVVRPKAAAIGPLIDETFGKAYKAGVKIAFGTDTGVSAHGDNAREFRYMVEDGMPPLEALRSATLSAAEVLDASGELGQIAPGFHADIIAIDGDPLADITTTERVIFVMKGGEVFRGAKQ